MTSGELLIGNLAIASVVIKTIVSALRQVFPILKENINITKGLVLLLGILSAFVIKAKMFDLVDSSTFIMYTQHVLAGLFIGATAMGVHESIKKVTSK